MGILDFIQHQFSHFERSARKKKLVENILNNPVQNNIDIVNLHRYDPSNIGDYYCAPHHYFKELNNKHLDIFDYKRDDENIRRNWVEKITQNSLIIGGGGLFNREGFEIQMKLFEQLGEKNKKTVIWGIGHNSKSKSSFGKNINYNVDTSKFGLVGVRDYGRKEEWIPCVSCLHPIFDKKNDVINEIGIVFHKKTLNNTNLIKKFDHFPSTANNADFEDVVKFISQSETILTDSYHAMYWSILLNKKVIVFPNSSKFYNFKYQPTISSFSNFENDLKKAKSYDGILEECRELNLKFAEKVFNYLNI